MAGDQMLGTQRIGAGAVRANGIETLRGSLGDGRGRPRVSFVLPAYNEAENIQRVIDRTVAAASQYCSVYEVVVVDDGSSDATAPLVEELARDNPCIRLVRHGVNRGYGDALRTGFASVQLDYVFFTDSDNQFDLDEIPLLLAWADRADVVAGYRRHRQDPWSRRLNAWGWNRLVRFLFYVPVRDVDCAFKLFRTEALHQITIESRGALINTEILVKLARRGAHVVEVGVTHLPRTAGEPTGANPRVVLRAFRELASMYPVLARCETPATEPARLPALRATVGGHA